MNRNRKKTVLPLEYQIESFFKKVLYLNHELVTKKIETNSKPPDIEKLDLETLIYEGMKQYEELIKIFKINSEKEKSKKRKSNSKKRHKHNFTKNRTDIYNFGNRRSKIEKETEKEYRNENYDYKLDDYNIDSKDLNNSKASKKNIKLFGSSCDKRSLKYNKNKYKYNKDDNKMKRSINLNKNEEEKRYSKNKKNAKNKSNSQNQFQNLNDYDYGYRKDIYNKYDDEDKYEIKKFNDNDAYEKENKYYTKERIYNYGNDRYDKLDKSPDYGNDYKEKYNDNEDDKYKYNDFNKENYNYNNNKFNIYDNYKKKEDKISKYSLNKETKYETFKRNITDDKINKTSINMKRTNNSLQSRYRYKFKYIGNKDKTASEVSDSKQNRWMKKKTDLSNSIISRSKIGDYDESQEVSRSRNMWLKKRMPISTLQKHDLNIVNKNQTFENERTKKYIKNLKMNYYNFGEKYEKHFDDNRNSQERKNSHKNIKDILVKSQRIGNDIYNINYGKIVNKNMYINIYKTEPKNNKIFFQKQKYEKKGINNENNVYNYTHNYYNIYKEKKNDDNNNIYGEYGKKLVGKEMLKKNIRDKEERERLAKKKINIYTSI